MMEIHLKKIQCKYAGFYKRDGHVADLRTTGGNQSFNTAKKYLDDSFDLLYILTENGKHYLLDWKEITCRSIIRIDSGKYDKFKI